MNQVIFPTVITAGLVDSLNPCAISVALIFIAVMFTLEKKRSFILRIGFFYIASVYLIYLLIGLGLLRTINIFNVPNLIVKAGAIAAILFGILNIKEYFFPHLPFKIRMPISARHKALEWAYKASIPGAIVMGIIIGITEFPCSGSVYLAIIGLLSAKVSFLTGILYLLVYNLMFVSPLILIFLLSTNRMITEKMINWQERQGRKMHLILAALMIGLGIIILTLYI